MDLEWNDLLVRLDGIDTNRLLVNWDWLLPENSSIAFVTAMGDAIVSLVDGTIHLLDTVDGRLIPAAKSFHEFKELMIQPENYVRWFLPDTVEELKRSGLSLANGQCFSPIVPPAIGGPVAPDNYHALDLIVHFAFLGGLHRELKHLPEGTPISRLEIKWTE
jgi:hypothetical protein